MKKKIFFISFDIKDALKVSRIFKVQRSAQIVDALLDRKVLSADAASWQDSLSNQR